MGSSFCRLSRVKLQNEDPRLNALLVVSWREINQLSLRFVVRAGLKQADSCSFCGEFTETLAHLFWYCSYTQKFWKDIYQWITQNTTLNKSIAFSPLICLGLIDNISDLLLHHLFLIAKRYIYTCKLNNCNPALQVYIQTVMNSMEIEKEIASNNNNMSSFKNKWSPLKLCPSDK